MSYSPHRIGILANPDGWYVRDLLRAAVHESIHVISFRDLQMVMLQCGGLRIGSRLVVKDNRNLEAKWIVDCENDTGQRFGFDAILVRTMPLGSLEQVIFRMNALHVIQQSGVPVLNPPRCLEIAIDKWLTLDVLSRAGLQVPRTIACQTRTDALEAFEQLGRDVVVKPLFGGEGRGIIRVSDPDMAWRVFGTLEQIGSVLYLQEFLPNQGFDIRLLVIGDEVYSVKRQARGDWRTNVSRGGEATPYHPTSQQLEIALKAARAVGGSVIGVDLLPTTDGRELILEVNAVPGWKGTARALQVDIARRILDQIRSGLSNGSLRE